ncbi:MAG: hypothetical protein WKG07_26300 [Hymenobacter sp.]
MQVVPAAGGAARPVSFLANSNSNTLSWSPDGKYLLFDTGQRTEDAQVARIDLQLRTPRFREDQFRDLFKETVPGPISPDKNQSPPLPPAKASAPTPCQWPRPTRRADKTSARKRRAKRAQPWPALPPPSRRSISTLRRFGGG